MQNKDIKPINDKGQAHGYWESYWNDGTLWYKCFFINDVEYGYEEILRYRIKKIKYYAR